MHHIMLVIFAILPLSFLLQSFTAVVFIGNAVVNITWLIFLLLQDLWTATQYLHTIITANIAA